MSKESLLNVVSEGFDFFMDFVNYASPKDTHGPVVKTGPTSGQTVAGTKITSGGVNAVMLGRREDKYSFCNKTVSENNTLNFGGMKMDKLISKITALGVPGLVLLVAIHVSGFAGGAAIITALSALGPGGIVGGIATLGLIGLISHGLTEFGMDAILAALYES